jgi:hypothetical protein
MKRKPGFKVCFQIQLVYRYSSESDEPFIQPHHLEIVANIVARLCTFR